jgi:two-component system, cell cycle sensor histidine kinase and response regulator CckA
MTPHTPRAFPVITSIALVVITAILSAGSTWMLLLPQSDSVVGVSRVAFVVLFAVWLRLGFVVRRFARDTNDAKRILREANRALEERATQRAAALLEAHEHLANESSARMRIEQRFQGLFDTSRDALMTLEPPTWAFTSGNAAALALFRAKSEEEFTSASPWVLSPERQPDGRPSDRAAKDRIDEAMRDGSASFEWTHKRLSGEEFPADVLLTRIDHGGTQFLQATVRDVTERKAFQAALVRAKEEWERTFDAVPELIALIDLNHRIIRVNRPMAERLRLRAEEVVGCHCYEAVHGLPTPPPFCPHSRLLVSGNEERGEVDEARLGGIFDVTTTPLRDDKGQLIGSVHVARDITDRKHAEEALRESEVRYHASFDAASVGQALAGLDGRFLEVNTALASMLGYSVAELRGKPFVELTHPDDVAMSVSARTALVAGEPVRRMEKRYVRKDGSLLWVDVSIAPVRDADGRLTQFVTHIIDISERKAVEAAIRLSEERFRELFAHLDHGVGVYEAVDGGRDFILRDLNASAERIDKVTRSAALGRRLTQLFPGIVRMGLLEVLRDVYTTGRPGHQAATLYQDERLTAWFENSVYRLSSGEIVAIHEDVSQRRSIEEQLRQAQKMEAVGRLAGGVAHDFNNLLSIIISYSKFALDALSEADPVRDDILEIHKAGARASTVVKELLAFSRQQVFQPEILDVNAVLRDLGGNLRRLLGDDVELVTVLAPHLSAVNADRAQLGQVVLNLAVNAKDAMPAGGTLTIATADVEIGQAHANEHPDIKPGPHVMLSITDTGAGMDAPTLARIFEPFFTTKETGRGTGLGLATAYGIVKQSGGDITARSALGRGTTFTIHLPRATDSGAAAPRPSLPVTRATGDETILLVEDEEAVRALSQRILVGAGYTVLAAANAGAALLLAERHAGRIHLLLTDVVMPQMGGKDLAERLEGVCSGMRVLYMSGYSGETIARHGVLAPGTFLIAKPFEATDLTAKVREVLDANLDAG